MLERNDTRRYRMLEVIGKGGFGKVYKARLDGPAGFVKDVAIKLLTDAEAPEPVLARFRDESRILGLVRDRAVITVDPPTRLDGRWAVVMEYVDGVSIAHLLSRAGPLPARVALEITAEAARALDKLYHQPGPDGAPLRVLHRDIKPNNLQVTPGGQVKILDFGIARAEFDGRESATAAELGGTVGFIPPERIEGVEGPAGDVYSLGVTLRFMVTGKRPTRRDREQTDEVTVPADVPGWSAALDLARRMTADEPEDRPTAREVEDLASQLAVGLPRPDLRRWAEANVPQSPTLDGDELVGNVLTETLAAVPRMDTADPVQPAAPPSRVARWIALLASVLVLCGVLGTLVVASISAGYVFAARSSRSTELGATEPAPVPEPAPEPEPEPEPAPGPSPEPATEPAPVPEPAPAPAPRAEVGPTPLPSPAAQRLPVLFSSVPMGAEVWVNGVRRGVTPLQGIGLTPGNHLVKMKLGDQTITRTIKVDRRAPSRFIWKGGDSWSSEY
jgi:hypothetical protein